MPNCPPTLSFADPGSFPSLPASLAGISAEVHSCKGGSMGRHRGPSRHPDQPKRCGSNDEANPCMVPTNIFLEGPYPDTTDINIIYGTPGCHPLTGLSTLSHPWGCRAPLRSRFWDALDLQLAGLGTWQHRESRVSLLSPQCNCSGRSKPGFNK